jgi:hypothetical protein
MGCKVVCVRRGLKARHINEGCICIGPSALSETIVLHTHGVAMGWYVVRPSAFHLFAPAWKIVDPFVRIPGVAPR